MRHKVYKVARFGGPLDHHALFIKTESDGSGTTFHVIGTIQNGMTYETTTTTERPEDSLSFAGKEFLGTVSRDDLPRIGEICSGNPPPKKQFNGPRRLYPSEPLRTCQEWAKETIEILEDEGIIRKD